MNNIHAIARIVFAALGIYIAVTIIPFAFGLVVFFFQQELNLSSIALCLFNLALMAISLAFLYYFFVCKRDWLAQKVVGTVDWYEPATDIHWLAAAFRIICVVAGVLFLYRFLIHITYYLSIQTISQIASGHLPFTRILKTSISWLVLLPFGIYLLCGAPHFVRWQVKKTLELCRRFEPGKEIKEN